MSEPAFTPARRGDLAAVVTEHHEYEIRDGHTRPLDFTTVELHTVTNITRDGRVKALRHVRYSDGARTADVVPALHHRSPDPG